MFKVLFTYHFQVVKVLILPRLKIESALMKQAQEGVDPVEKNAAENLKTLLLVRKAVLFFCDDGESEDIFHSLIVGQLL